MLFRRKAASANRPIKRRAAFVARLLPPNPEAEAIAHQLAKALATIQVEVEHRRRLEAKLLTAVEEERQRLGRDLHDELSQRLAATALMTHTLAKEAKGRSELDREKIRTIGNMLSEAIGKPCILSVCARHRT